MTMWVRLNVKYFIIWSKIVSATRKKKKMGYLDWELLNDFKFMFEVTPNFLQWKFISRENNCKSLHWKLLVQCVAKYFKFFFSRTVGASLKNFDSSLLWSFIKSADRTKNYRILIKNASYMTSEKSQNLYISPFLQFSISPSIADI